MPGLLKATEIIKIQCWGPLRCVTPMPFIKMLKIIEVFFFKKNFFVVKIHNVIKCQILLPKGE